MAVSVKIELDLSALKDENLKQALQSRLNDLAKREYNRLGQDVQSAVKLSKASSSKDSAGLNTLGGPFGPARGQRDGSKFINTSAVWNKFWYAEADRFDDRFARVYIGCGNGTKVLEINYDFLYQFTRLPETDPALIQEGINNVVPGWVGGADQLVKDTDYPPFTYFERYFGGTFAAGNNVRGYTFCQLGQRWIYQPQFSSGSLSILDNGPFWLGQHLQYNPIRNNLKLEHVVLPYKDGKAVVVVYGANIVQEHKVDFIRSSYCGGTKESLIRVFLHSPFFYSRAQNSPKHEYIIGRAPDNFQIESIVARMAPYPCDSTASFDEDTVIQFQIMAAPNAGDYYSNEAEPPTEWLDGYELTPVLTVTTVPVDPDGEPPLDHGYDLNDVFTLPLVGQGAGPRVYRSFAIQYPPPPVPGEPEPDPIVTPSKGDYIWIKIISVRNGDGDLKWPIQDTTGYNFDRYNHNMLFVDFNTNLGGVVGPSGSSTSSFLAKCDLVESRYQETQYTDPTAHPLVKCFLVSEGDIKEIPTPNGVIERVIPKTFGTIGFENELLDENEEPIPEDFTLIQQNNQLHFASGGDPLDSGDFGPRVKGVFDTEPKNIIVNSENLNTSYPQLSTGQNVSAILNTIGPPADGFKNADRLQMPKKKRSAFYETGPHYNYSELRWDPSKTYNFSAWFKWTGTGEEEESYPGEEIGNTDLDKTNRTFVTLSHYNDDGLVSETTIKPLGFDWYRHSFMFQPTGKNDKIRLWTWDSSENATIDYAVWGLQIEEFQGTSTQQQEGPTEYQKRDFYTQAFYAGVFPDSTNRKSTEPLPLFSIDTVPVYQYVPFEFADGAQYTDFPVDLGLKGEPYNWLDSVTWREYNPQSGDLINPIGSPFGRWSPVIYDVLFNDYKGSGISTESRNDYNAPIFNSGPKNGGQGAGGGYITSHLGYDPVEYAAYPVMPYNAPIKRLAEGELVPLLGGGQELKKGQKTARFNVTNDEPVYGHTRLKGTQAIAVDTVAEFETINKKKTRNRYNWSTDQKQMRICQYTDYNRGSENLEYLQQLGFSLNDLNF